MSVISDPKGVGLLTDIMNREIVVATPEMSARELAQLLSTHMISGTPVVDSAGRLVGVVSASDLISLQASQGQSETSGYHRDLWLEAQPGGRDLDESVTVGDLMSHHVFQLEESTPIEEAVDLMLDWYIHRVIVTRKGKLMGVVTTMDLLKHLRRLLPGSMR